jgi:hypothetical protein
MLNKKLLATAVALSISSTAMAAIDLNADTGSVLIGQQLVAGADVVDGLVQITNTATLLNVNTNAGFVINDTEARFIRYTVPNGEFASVPTLQAVDSGAVTVNGTVTAGGNGENFVIFSIQASAGESIDQGTDLVLAANYGMNAAVPFTINYAMYETATAAIGGGTGTLATESGTIATAVNLLDGGDFATPTTLTALVAQEFKQFTGSVNTGTLAALDVAGLDGLTDGAATPPVVVYTPGLVAFDPASDFVTAAAKVTFTGDFSFGSFTYNGSTWALDTDGDLAVTGGSGVVNADGTVTVDYAAGNLTVNTGGTAVAQKGTYTAALAGVTTGVTAPVFPIGTFTEAAGAIEYDTTSIELPYVTTFSGYNQRIYIINDSAQDAAYTTTFITEDGTMAMAGSAATGTVPAGEMVTIRATDLVTLTGGTTRTSATIEIEAQPTSIRATTQTINRTDGTTDTVTLSVN